MKNIAKMVGTFASIYLFLAATIGLLARVAECFGAPRLGAQELAALMTVVTGAVAVWYTAKRARNPANRDDVFSTGDWLLGFSASVGAVLLFSWPFIYIGGSAGVLSIAVAVLYLFLFNRYGMCGTEPYVGAFLCQWSCLPLIALVAAIGWWNAAIVGAGVIIGALAICAAIYSDTNTTNTESWGD